MSARGSRNWPSRRSPTGWPEISPREPARARPAVPAPAHRPAAGRGRRVTARPARTAPWPTAGCRVAPPGCRSPARSAPWAAGTAGPIPSRSRSLVVEGVDVGRQHRSTHVTLAGRQADVRHDHGELRLIADHIPRFAGQTLDRQRRVGAVVTGLEHRRRLHGRGRCGRRGGTLLRRDHRCLHVRGRCRTQRALRGVGLGGLPGSTGPAATEHQEQDCDDDRQDERGDTDCQRPATPVDLGRQRPGRFQIQHVLTVRAGHRNMFDLTRRVATLVGRTGGIGHQNQGPTRRCRPGGRAVRPYRQPGGR